MHIVILGQPSPGLDEVTKRLVRDGRFQVTPYFSMAEIHARFDEASTELLVVYLAYFDESKIEWVERVRRRFPRLALITISSEIEPKARFALKGVNRFRLLDEKYELRDLISVVEKVCAGDPAMLRMHARVAREGWAELIEPSGIGKMRAQFLDFAQMGARLVVNSDQIQAKSKWILRYPSSTEPGKFQSLYCYVVWQTAAPQGWEKHFKGAHKVVGLRFVAAA